MITKDQEYQIVSFLDSKRLYPQFHLEVKDHFISQISHLMENESLSFQEAFLATKISWKNELEMVRADFFSFKKIAKIERTVLQDKFRKMTVFSFIFSLAAFVLMMVDADIFVTLQILLLLSWIVLLGYSFLTKKMKFSNYMMLSFHPLLIRNILFGIALIFIAGTFKYDYNEIIDSQISNLLIVYCVTVELQLVYFNSKKINVLI
ncbi:hypothetical protein [Chryseobacterium hispalense]|uniref:hypothetical protein n=1 Tax=Chryseobacterium hispalense TaxID=1453492 RepID=UPI0039187B2F